MSGCRTRGKTRGSSSRSRPNVASGVIVLAAKAALSSLDVVAFDQWLSAFLERLEVTSGVFPKESLSSQRPGDARAPGSARTALENLDP